METSPQPKGDNQNQHLTDYAGQQHQGIELHGLRMNTDLAKSTNGQLSPSYAYVSRAAGFLFVGEAVVEPHLGQVRLAATEDFGAYAQLTWSDDYGSSHAAGRYAVEQVFPVRVPSQVDYQYIEQKVNAAGWRSHIPSRAARLIAAHLHAGPRSQLYRFALNGELLEPLFDELNGLVRRQPHYALWVHALARFCIDRYDPELLAGWRPPLSQAQDGDIATSRSSPRRTNARNQQADGSLLRGRLDADFVRQLLDAAFDLGVAAARRTTSMGGRSALSCRPGSARGTGEETV